MTSRLDIVIDYLGTQITQGNQQTALLYELQVQGLNLYNALVEDDAAILPYMQQMLYELRVGQASANANIEDIEAVAEDIKFLEQEQLNEDYRAHEQRVFMRLYLQQILNVLQNNSTDTDDDDSLPDIPDDPDFESAEGIEFEQPSTVFATARNNFKQRLVDTGKTITFLDQFDEEDPEQPEHTYETPGVTIGNQLFESTMLTFDYQQYTGVRDLVQAFVVFSELLACMTLVWAETKKR